MVAASLIAFLDQYFTHQPVSGRCERIFHLHRFHDQKRLFERDRLAGLDENFQNSARHRRVDDSRAFGHNIFVVDQRSQNQCQGARPNCQRDPVRVDGTQDHDFTPVNAGRQFTAFGKRTRDGETLVAIIDLNAILGGLQRQAPLFAVNHESEALLVGKISTPAIGERPRRLTIGARPADIPAAVFP